MKKSSQLLVLAAGLLAFLSPNLECAFAQGADCAPASAGLLGWWRAEGDATDSASLNHGTLRNGAAFATGRVGQAFNFNGANQFVEVPNSASLNPAGSFTIEGWIHPRRDRVQVIMGKWGFMGDTPDQRSYIFHTQPDGGLTFGISDATNQWNNSLHLFSTTNNVIALNTWNHVAAVYDQPTGTRRMYVNGLKVAERVDAPITILNGTSKVGIGAWMPTSTTSAEYFDGLVDEIAFYERALSRSELQAIYNAGSAGKCVVPVPPFIVSQPQSQTVAVGGNVTFSVEASGSGPLNYQWYFNGTDLPDSTTASLTLANVRLNDAGDYSVVVANLAGSAVSSNAFLTVIPAPPCTPAPTGLVSWWPGEGNAIDVVGGSTASLANGIMFTNGTVNQAFLFDGVNNQVLVPALLSLNVQSFTVEAWINPADIRTQRPIIEYASPSGRAGVHLWISVAPAGTLNSPGRLFANVRDATVRDHIIVSPPDLILSNQWSHVALTFDQPSGEARLYVNGATVTATNLGIFVPQTSLPLNIGFRPLGSQDGGATTPFVGRMDEISLYNRALSNSEVQAIYSADSSGKCAGSVPPSILTQPQSQTVEVGGNVTFNVVAVGSVPLSYQWYLNGTNLPGSTTASLTFTNVQLADAGNYSVVGTNLAGSAVSSNAVLTIVSSIPCVPPPAGILGWWRGEGDAMDALGGNHGTLRNGTAIAAGRVGQAFSFNGVNQFVEVPTRASLNPPGSLTIEGWIFPRKDGAQVIMGKWGFTGDTVDQRSYIFQTVLGNGLVFAISDAAHQWDAEFHYFATTNNAITFNLWNHVAAVYDQATGTRRIFVNGLKVAERVDTPITILNGTSKVGIGTWFSSSMTSGEYFDGLIDELSLYSRALSQSEIQAIYNAGSAGKCVVPVPPFIASRPQDQTVVAGSRVTFNVTASGTSPLSYQWAVNGADIQGATNALLVLDSVQAGQAGAYAVKVRNEAGSVTSLPAMLTVHPVPTAVLIVTQPQDQTVPVGGTATFSVAATGTDPLTYRWYFNGAPLSGGTSAILVISNVQSNKAGSYTVRVSNPYGPSVTSVAATLRIGPLVVPPSITAQPGFQSVNVGATATFTVIAAGTGPLSYQWSLNGAYIPGATEATFTIGDVQLSNQGTYIVTVSNGVGTATSAGAVLTVFTGETGGTVMFSNVGIGINAPIFDVNGITKLEGANFLAQLYAGPTLDSLKPIGAAVPFLTGTGAGYWNPSIRVIPTVAPGQMAAVQIHVWDSTKGTTYEQVASIGGKLGSSAVLNVKTGGDGEPPALPAVLEGLQSFSLGESPHIVSQPESRVVLEGTNVTFSLQVYGSQPLRYQWQFNGVHRFDATNDALTVSTVQAQDTGDYVVIVSNGYGTNTSHAAHLTVEIPDRLAPIVTISMPQPGPKDNERTELTGTATDNVGVTVVRWERNGQAMGNLTLSNGLFTVPDLRLNRSENRFRVIALDSAGNEGTAEVLVTWAPSRVLTVIDPLQQQEGSLIVVPLELVSQGDVGGMTFILRYDPEFLRDPEFYWGSLPEAALREANLIATGEIRATFASTTPVSAGLQRIANVTFRARSVPSDLTTPLNLEIVEVADTRGTPVVFGTDLQSGAARILKRKIPGDNNANNRLDVGDGSIVLRLVTKLDIPRTWDVIGNDLNLNSELDSGDVIRVLRTVVGLDPQPEIPSEGGSALLTRQSTSELKFSSHATGLAVLSSDRTRAEAGQTVIVQVRLQDIRTQITGASLTLEYPPNALKLMSPQSHRTGDIVPASAFSLWNVAPAQTNYAAQDGRVLLAVSSAVPWPLTNGIIAEFTFEVQPGQVERYRWLIKLSNLEISKDGFNNQQLPPAEIFFTGRDPHPAMLTSALDASSSEVRLNVAGEYGISYVIEASEDFEHWTPIATLINATGMLQFTDPDRMHLNHRFYRAKQLE